MQLVSLEDGQHIFFSCNFSARVWNYLQIGFGGGGGRRPCFPEVVILACWAIWKQWVFRQTYFHGMEKNFVLEVIMLKNRAISSVIMA
jgi:hypothetical protein